MYILTVVKYIIDVVALYFFSRLTKVFITLIKEHYKTKRNKQIMDVIELFVISEPNDNHNIKSTYIKEFEDNSSKAIGEYIYSEIKNSSDNNEKENDEENDEKELGKIINIAKHLNGNDDEK